MLWLRPTAQILGFVLRKDHTLELRDKVAVIKMMGGGSFIIAYPALVSFYANAIRTCDLFSSAPLRLGPLPNFSPSSTNFMTSWTIEVCGT